MELADILRFLRIIIKGRDESELMIGDSVIVMTD